MIYDGAHILPFKGIMPTIADSALIMPGAMIIGDVHIGEESSIWPGVVVRGDVNHIRIGARTNIQDNSTVHVTRRTAPTIIGNGITVGHNVMLHGCTLEDDCFVGMSATIIDKAVVSSGAMVAAGALVTQRKTVPSGELWAGNPAKKLRDLRQEESDFIPQSAVNYVGDSRDYMS